MGGGNESGRTQRRRIDAEAKACFLQALRAGETREAAAQAAGFSCEAFYGARKRDPVFRLAWLWALEASAAEERQRHRASSLAALADGVEIAPNNGRRLQLRRVRHPRFTEARRQIFLANFAVSADLAAAAAIAGVHESTVYRHLARDPDFARRYDEALFQAYRQMEAEEVRQQLAAQKAQRESPAPAKPAPGQFERTMRLLEHRDRRGGGIGAGAAAHGAQKRGTFMEGIAWLDRALRGLGIRWDIAADPIELPRPAAPDDPPAGEAGG